MNHLYHLNIQRIHYNFTIFTLVVTYNNPPLYVDIDLQLEMPKAHYESISTAHHNH